MPFNIKAFLCTSLHRQRKNMEISRWSIESYDQLRERISGAVQQMQLKATQDIQDEDKRTEENVELLVEYFDSERWVPVASNEDFLTATGAVNDERALILRVGPAGVWDHRRKGRGNGRHHRGRWMRRFAKPASGEESAQVADNITPEKNSVESDALKKGFPRAFVQHGLMRRHMWRGRRHHGKHNDDPLPEKQGQDAPKEQDLRAPRRFRMREKGKRSTDENCGHMKRPRSLKGLRHNRHRMFARMGMHAHKGRFHRKQCDVPKAETANLSLEMGKLSLHPSS